MSPAARSAAPAAAARHPVVHVETLSTAAAIESSTPQARSPDVPGVTAADVPTKVFEQFLADLTEAKVPEEIVKRFRKTLIEERAFSDAALRKAVFGDEDVSP